MNRAIRIWQTGSHGCRAGRFAWHRMREFVANLLVVLRFAAGESMATTMRKEITSKKTALTKAALRGELNPLAAANQSAAAEKFLRATLDFFPGQVFDVRGERPVVARRIKQAAGAVAVKLVTHGPGRRRARRHGTCGEGVHVWHINQDADRCAAKRGRALTMFGKLIGQHNDCAGNFDLGMTNSAIGHGNAIKFSCAKSLLVKLNSLHRVLANEIRGRMFVPSRNGKRFGCHAPRLETKSNVINPDRQL